jgi:DNA-binding NarL/FixJ family response regulator
VRLPPVSNNLSPEVGQRLQQSAEPDPYEVLTERQLEIMRLLVSGHSSKEIGFSLNLSPKTVDVHRAAIMSRLGVGDVATLTLYAVRVGIVDPAQVARIPRKP